MIFIVGGAYQGKTEYARLNYGTDYRIINGYHLKVRQQLEQGDDPLEEVKKILAESEKLVIISDDIGCGLVPVDAFERRYREASGRVNCYLAKEAEQVIRMVCGVPARIK